MSLSHTAPPLFSYHMPSFSFPGIAAEQLFDHGVGLTQAAESAGFDLVTVMDHFYQIGAVGPETEPMLEAYSTLAALAARTDHVRLGTQVTGVTYRNPAGLPAERLAMSPPTRIERAAEILREYMDAGVQGFTFNNPQLSTPELLSVAGELKRMLGSPVAQAVR